MNKLIYSWQYSLEEWNAIGEAWRPYSRKLAVTYIPLGEFIKLLLYLKEANQCE